jgi:hypothetical protein
MPIDVLPDDVLLEIFDFITEKGFGPTTEEIEVWQTLVHVCRHWRRVVFGSPRPARDTPDVWPTLPLFIRCDEGAESADNIIAALERSDRVCHIDPIGLKRSDLEISSAAMYVPFPELTHLILWSKVSKDETMSVLPDSFLGESDPTSGRSLIEWHSISEFTGPAFVCHSPHHSWA